MDQIIGQNELVTKLKSYSFQNMPKTLLFLGENGSGKHFISKCFAQHLGVELEEINSQTTAEQLIEIYQSSLPKVYLLDLSTIAEKQQHKYLKFIEEPASNMRIILIAESEIGILPTILNRCIKYNLADYTVEQLRQFSWASQIENELAFKLCNTPGQLLTLSNTENLESLQEICNEIVINISKMPYSHCLSYSCKINCKEDYNKFDFDLFIKMLIYVAYDNFINSKVEEAFVIYSYLVQRKQLLINKTLAKEAFLISSLDELWRLINGTK